MLLSVQIILHKYNLIKIINNKKFIFYRIYNKIEF